MSIRYRYYKSKKKQRCNPRNRGLGLLRPEFFVLGLGTCGLDFGIEVYLSRLFSRPINNLSACMRRKIVTFQQVNHKDYNFLLTLLIEFLDQYCTRHR